MMIIIFKIILISNQNCNKKKLIKKSQIKKIIMNQTIILELKNLLRNNDILNFVKQKYDYIIKKY